ncbi:hypothetical protein, partial [Thiocapsa sp.]|uniref:hypothetical protein n=1 Tax=Thiocapsa sp. TaxID=2024551 RepID=UPI003594571C
SPAPCSLEHRHPQHHQPLAGHVTHQHLPTRSADEQVVLGGAVPGWVGVWSGRTPRPIADDIRASSLASVPDHAPLAMGTQRIDPCCHRLVRRIARLLRGLSPGPLHRRADLGQST